MKIIDSISELRATLSGEVALVPTMGAFHSGHLALMSEAKNRALTVVTSLFVNPTQFGPNEDFNRYPRDLDADAEMAESVGVDVLFAPTVQDIYPRPGCTIHVPEVSERYEGAHRPGHFDGVATVVCKLFNIVQPTVALFGLKDLQQCMVIRRMVEDLNLNLKLEFLPTVREDDGLAMSSRNRYLSSDERAIAPALHEELVNAKLALNDRSEDTLSILEDAKTRLNLKGFDVDYFDLVNLETMSPVLDRAQDTAIITAARLGKTRLIDNVLV